MYFLVLQSQAGEYTVASCNDNADPVLEARARSAILVGVKSTKRAALALAAIARRDDWSSRRTPWPTASLAGDVQNHAAPMRRRTVFENVDALPGS